MTDLEMMELAALAAGIVIVRSRLHDPLNNDMLIENSARNPGQRTGGWNPKDNDGDSRRLEVALRLEVYHSHDAGEGVGYCYVGYPSIDRCILYVFEPHGADPYAATRLAVLRAAAEMGKRMRENAA